MSLHSFSRPVLLSRYHGAKGYPWLSWPRTPSAWVCIIIFITVIIAVSFFVSWYTSVYGDNSPDSPLGYSEAAIGTSCFLAALLLYWRKRRSHHRAVGQLHAALNWHILFGLLGLFFLLLHGSGNFNARSGTYALYGMIALVISGVVGRIFDRLLPRLCAREVQTALTTQGEDRIDQITQELSALQRTPIGPAQNELYHWRSQAGSFPQNRQQTQILALQHVQQALQREQVYRHVIRYWRVFHRLLALVTVGLTIWHIVYAVQLLLPH